MKLLLPLLLLSLSGCVTAKTPLAQVYNAKAEYATLLEALGDLRDQGVISQAQVTATKPARVLAKAALDEWEAAAKAGQPTQDAESRFQAAAEILRRLKYSTTRPATGAYYHGDGNHGSGFGIGQYGLGDWLAGSPAGA